MSMQRAAWPRLSLALVAALAMLGLACGPSPAPSTPSSPRLSVSPGAASDAELRAAVAAAYPARGHVACCPPAPCGSSICAANREEDERAAEERDAEFVRRFGQAAFDQVRSAHGAWVRSSCASVTCPRWGVDVPEPQ